ncbi:tRNA sulfurtransferase [Halorubellus sp. JP-L1]|uniref:tRNA sulfurtransferase n=1 Tax=Halorubellus sp. JP-L1 TaxID=2715753 RepID=UPI00140D9C41|nr:tRNA sulfurtransferase [Halorubellus sp. JP-L1]NHN40295.1 tRNA sulfurtransferase [Halorubellus sp. JP-L1]
MQLPGADVVLVRHGDLGSKSRGVKRDMEHRLGENLRTILDDRDLAGDVELTWSRPRVHTTEGDAAAVARAAADTFGVVSASPALTVESDLDAISDALTETAREVYDAGAFAVDARRSDRSLAFDSEDVQREGGQAIWDAVADAESDGFEPEVDLDDPDVRFGVEVREEATFVYTETVEGVGGLPLGTQAPLVALVSGGIDSPVAAFEVMKRGSPVVPVYVDLGDYGGPDHRARAVQTVRDLSRYAPNVDLTTWVVPGGDAVSRLVDGMDRGRMLSHRRFLLAVGEAVAKRSGAAGVVTGEAIGQKSSQTTRNLAVTDAATTLPVHRPLLAWDKHDVTERAREIGTFADSTIDAGCNRIVPDEPVVAGSRDQIRALEPDGLFEWAAEAVADAERVPIGDDGED